MKEGALGCSISGAGPTMFALARAEDAERVRAAMQAGFTGTNIKTDGWIVEINSRWRSACRTEPCAIVSTRGGAARELWSGASATGLRRTAGLYVPEAGRVTTRALRRDRCRGWPQTFSASLFAGDELAPALR